MTPPAVSVVIPQRNQVGLTLNCVSTFPRHHPSDVELVIVDDGSRDRERSLAKRCLRHQAIWVEQDPLGVTAAWRTGIHASSGEVIILLNNDTISTGPWIDPLAHALLANNRTMVGPQLRTESRLPTEILSNLPTTRMLSGWCLAFRRHDYESVGGLDPRFTTYWSDTDLQLRMLTHLTHRAGLDEIPSHSLIHLKHRTANQLPEKWNLWRQDRDCFVDKWTPQTFTPSETRTQLRDG